MATQKLQAQNEQTWLQVGNLAETMNEADRAMAAYEAALRHNPCSIPALTQIAALCRQREQYGKAVEYFQRILNIDQSNGEIWGALGHCYLMMDNLQKAYSAYQQALYHLPNPKEPKLWYGIGILYDRYGSYEHAEEAFAAVIRMEPKFEKANEIYFRLGIIYKQQGKYDTSLQCFRYILSCPPKPLTEIDIWFQIGHVYEQQKEYRLAQEAYERVLAENPNHAKVLQQLGWLYHQQNSSFSNQELAISFLTRSLEADMNDAQTWYLLGRCYMAQQKYNKAYEAYQQAVYRDGRNPTFWCSIGVLYYQINQYRDALDAYSRAIRLNPYISEVWYDLGTLYESCNNQINDALDAYTRALELDPTNPHIKQRLQMLRNAQATGGQVQAGAAQPQQPMPQDVNPAAYPPSNGMHPNPTPQFYQGPQPPNQMGGFSRPPQADQRQPHGLPPPPMDQEGRRDLAALQGPGGAPYSQHPQQRDDMRGQMHPDRSLNQLANEAVRQQQQQQHQQQPPSRSKGARERAGSPKGHPSEARRAGGSSRAANRMISPGPYGHEEAAGRRDSPQFPAHPGDQHQRQPELRGRQPDLPGRAGDARSVELARPGEPQYGKPTEHLARLPEMHSRQPEAHSREGEQMGRPLDVPSRYLDSRAPHDLPRLPEHLSRPSEQMGDRFHPEQSDRNYRGVDHASHDQFGARQQREVRVKDRSRQPDAPSRRQQRGSPPPLEDRSRAHRDLPPFGNDGASNRRAEPDDNQRSLPPLQHHMQPSGRPLKDEHDSPRGFGRMRGVSPPPMPDSGPSPTNGRAGPGRYLEERSSRDRDQEWEKGASEKREEALRERERQWEIDQQMREKEREKEIEREKDRERARDREREILENERRQRERELLESEQRQREREREQEKAQREEKERQEREALKAERRAREREMERERERAEQEEKEKEKETEGVKEDEKERVKGEREREQRDEREERGAEDRDDAVSELETTGDQEPARSTGSSASASKAPSTPPKLATGSLAALASYEDDADTAPSPVEATPPAKKRSASPSPPSIEEKKGTDETTKKRPFEGDGQEEQQETKRSKPSEENGDEEDKA